MFRFKNKKMNQDFILEYLQTCKQVMLSMRCRHYVYRGSYMSAPLVADTCIEDNILTDFKNATLG